MTDREKAMKEIEILKEDYWNDDGYGHETNQHDNTMLALDMAIKALEQTRWIPVSEGLPERNMRCLVAVGQFNFTEIATYSDLMGTIDHQIFYRGDVGHDNFKNITQYVKAWMPLPEPYTEGGEQNE